LPHISDLLGGSSLAGRRIAPVTLTFNQRKNALIKAADLARDDYQLLVLPRKLRLPNMRSQRVRAAGLTQFV
jgi:hypothetical protein